MKTKIISIILIALVLLAMGTIVSNAAISGNSQTINSGENVTITINSSVKVSSYKVSVTSEGGLTYVSCADANGGQSGNKMIAGSPSNGATRLGTFTFKAPTVTTDTKYTVSFSASAMETPDLEEVPDSSTSVTITVKAPAPTPTPTPTSTPTPTPVQNNSNGGTTSNENNGSTGTTTKPVTKSSNNNLSNLGIKPNDFTGFKANKTEYSVTVPNNVSEVTVYASAHDKDKAKISGTGKMQLNVGTNQAKVVCTAEDGSSKTYTINITRSEKVEEQPAQVEEQPVEEQPVQDETPETTEVTPVLMGLTKLELVGKNEKGESLQVELSPAFEEAVSEYAVTVPLSVVEVEVNAESADGKAQIEVMGNKDLVEGQNIVTVIAKTGETTKVYQITVNKVAQVAGSLSQELLTQLAVIAGIITLIIVAIIAIIIMIVRNSRKGKEKKSTTEVSNEILEEDKKE